MSGARSSRYHSLHPVDALLACYEQQGNTLNLFTADNTDRSINLLFWRGEIPSLVPVLSTPS